MKPATLPLLLVLAVQPGCSGDIQTNPSDGGSFVASDATVEIPEHITFSHRRGFYQQSFTLTITSTEEYDEIRYTLDGLAPSATSGEVYTAPLELTNTTLLRVAIFKDGEQLGTSLTHSYLFEEEIFTQGDERPEGEYVFWTTEMDPQITESPDYASSLHAALVSIPSLSVVVSDEALFGVAGIHRGNNLMPGSGGNAGDAPHPDAVEEIQISLEFIYPEDYPRGAFRGFQVEAGLKPQGGGGRWRNGTYDHKQSFGLRFRGQYGYPSLKYPIFEDAPLHAEGEAGKYDKLILRSGHNKSWGVTWDNINSVYTRDQLGRDLQLAMNGQGARGTFVHLFLNGLYWGLYNVSERPDDAHSANYLGGQEEEWYSGKAKGGTVDGDDSRFSEWRSIVAGNGDFSQLEEYLDVDRYLDMCLLNVYAATGDFPQYYFGNRMSPEPGPIVFYAWDMEDAFAGGSRRTGPPSIDRFDGCYEFYAMWDANAEFRARLAQRASALAGADGALSDAKVLEAWNRLNAYVEEAMILESARWGDERISETSIRFTRNEHWREARDRVSSDLNGRAEQFLEELRSNTRNQTPYLP